MARGRPWIAMAALACALAWWLWLHPAHRPAPAMTGAIHERAGGCTMPPQVTAGEAPLQTAVPPGLALPAVAGAALAPLAGFSVDARVLGREDYRLGREADYSPVDLALGWGRMADDAVLARLSISQGGRWYRYRWQGEPPIPVAEIVRSSANMHMIPANAEVARTLRGVRRDDTVRIDGWLVQVDAPDGWRWRSSVTRDDTGAGACELVYVCAIGVE